MGTRVICCLLWLLGSLVGGASWADETSGPLLPIPSGIEAKTMPAVDHDAAVELKLANRSVVTLRSSLLGESAQARVRRAERVIREALQEGGELAVSIQPIESSYLILLGEQRAFIVTAKDLLPEDESVQVVAEQAAANLRVVITETQQIRSARYLLQALAVSTLVSVLLVLCCRLLFFTRTWLLSRLLPLMRQHAARIKVGHTSLFDVGLLFPIWRRMLDIVCWSLVLLCGYEWLSYVLQQFPYTRPWGEGLDSYLLALISYFMTAIVTSLPGLIIVLVIFLLAKGVIALLKTLMTRLAQPSAINWLTPETLAPTNRLISLAVWLFAFAMAYPYLPGSGTEAFKGLSVLIGLMVSLGASNVVGQAAAGLILTYSGTIRVGEFVRIAEHEGTVIEMGVFNTRILTGLGETLTIPNTLIATSVSKNYSRIVKGSGYIVDTSVTIGYDTPWRQVEALLLEACLRTEGIQADPSPQVFQTALSDYYPEYRLVAHAVPSEPRSRALLLSLLHANIQDVFNEYGVQIMSPHYIADPADAKLVAKANWHAAPAKPPHDEQQ